MAAPKIQIDTELVVEGKRLYETTLTPLRDIAALMGISLWTLQNRIAEWRWKRRRRVGVGIDLYRAVRGAAVATVTAQASAPADAAAGEPVSPQQRAALAVRLQNVVEREIAAVERVLDAVGEAKKDDAESSARTLASISRTVREIAALNQPDEVTPTNDADPDPVPRDIDEFRRELARRIRGFIEARRIGAGGISAQRKPEMD